MDASNRIFSGVCFNTGNVKSNVQKFEILSVRDIYSWDGEIVPETIETAEEYYNLDNLSAGDPYYAVYATFKEGHRSIKIFESEELRSVIFVVEQLTGNKVIQDYNEEI